jgi:hypothetical protein
MFGFWSYELRIGHMEWSNEQECFGRPLVVKGVQHPAPALVCNAFRVTPPTPAAPRIVVTAPFATPVFADQKLTRFDQGDPRTRLWVLLYAQVAQADGTSRRNVLLARVPATPRLEMTALGSIRPVSTRDLFGVAEFDPVQVERALAVLALPADTPLSALVVELLPGDHCSRRKGPSARPTSSSRLSSGRATSFQIFRTEPQIRRSTRERAAARRIRLAESSAR